MLKKLKKLNSFVCAFGANEILDPGVAKLLGATRGAL